jgi:hypothetical protein
VRNSSTGYKIRPARDIQFLARAQLFHYGKQVNRHALGCKTLHSPEYPLMGFNVETFWFQDFDYRVKGRLFQHNGA